MSTTAITTNIKNAVAAQLAAIQLPEGVVISTDVQQQIADAGVRGTLEGLDASAQASISIIHKDDDGNAELFMVTPSDILASLFGDINS